MNSDEPISEADYKWRVTRTDGVAVSSYAFDDFGRNVDPFTGKIREHKHGYTTDGNIIQPFAFTGYQEDEVSGLKFAQARFYDAENGRFVGIDQVGGFVETPDTQNNYLYCFNDSKNLIDRNGKFANILIGAGIGALIGAGVDAISQGVAIAKGEQDHFDFGELAGATVEGAVVGGIASTGVGAGLAGSMFAGGVGAAAGNVTTQLINTGSVDAGQLAMATGAGIVGGGLGYGIGKGISKISSKVAPKIPNKIDDFVTKRRVASGGASVNTATPKQCRLEMDLQFFAKESGCPFEGGGVYDGVREASKYLKELGLPHDIRKDILESFDIRTIKVDIAGSESYGLRFYGEMQRLMVHTCLRRLQMK